VVGNPVGAGNKDYMVGGRLLLSRVRVQCFNRLPSVSGRMTRAAWVWQVANKAKRAGLGVAREGQGNSPAVWDKENLHPNGSFAERSDSVSPTASEEMATAHHHVIPFERPAAPSESEAEAMEAALAAYDTLHREEVRGGRLLLPPRTKETPSVSAFEGESSAEWPIAVQMAPY